MRLCLKLRQRLAFGIQYLKKPVQGGLPPWRVWAEPSLASLQVDAWYRRLHEKMDCAEGMATPSSVSLVASLSTTFVEPFSTWKLCTAAGG